MDIKRKKTRIVKIGNVLIGGKNPVVIQTMTKTKTTDISSTIKQIREVKDKGAQIIRIGIPDMQSAEALKEIKKLSPLPIIADIHFDYKLAIAAIENGCDGLRLNPGNIQDILKIKQIVYAAKNRKIPIRIGVNMGSINRTKFFHSARGLVDSALYHIKILEKLDFKDIKVSLKSSDVLTTVEAYRLFSKERDYPLHIGITEAGTEYTGLIKNSIGCGILLAEGLGDTIRVSLTADPVKEVLAAKRILNVFGLYKDEVEIISCPTCSRTEYNIKKISEEIEEKISSYTKGPLKIAIMGCNVNGPGEAKDADIGIAASKNGFVLFKKGKVSGLLDSKDIIKNFLKEIEKLINQKNQTLL